MTTTQKQFLTPFALIGAGKEGALKKELDLWSKIR